MTEYYDLAEAQAASRRANADMIAAQVIKGREMVERQKAEALAIERKAFIRAFVLKNLNSAGPGGGHYVSLESCILAGVRCWDAIEARA